MDNNDKTNNYLTPIDKEKIPKKKVNFKELLYRKRIRYGKYIDMGIVNPEVKFSIQHDHIIYHIDESNVKEEQSENELQRKYFEALYYCSDLDFSIMPSKREIKLRKMLSERLTKYKNIVAKKKEVDKVKDKNNEKDT